MPLAPLCGKTATNLVLASRKDSGEGTRARRAGPPSTESSRRRLTVEPTRTWIRKQTVVEYGNLFSGYTRKKDDVPNDSQAWIL